jgi:hypothetical protein
MIELRGRDSLEVPVEERVQLGALAGGEGRPRCRHDVVSRHLQREKLW